ncbi:hypothetical protein PQR13_08980 [Paraburkholderia strydomiana]|uniref:hypothetical protein n=1 Tax=Paraburkholderia strydomiana TaxID=1245417 RepID=UPI0038BA2C20
MAACIVPHPLSSISLEADLANVFELDDPMPTWLARVEELATACSNDYPVESASLAGSSNCACSAVRRCASLG